MTTGEQLEPHATAGIRRGYGYFLRQCDDSRHMIDRFFRIFKFLQQRTAVASYHKMLHCSSNQPTQSLTNDADNRNYVSTFVQT